jgi:arabinose-5-phosphate isomerase
VDALSRMTESRLGTIVVVNQRKILGILTDGDIRRALERYQLAGTEPLRMSVSTLMTRRPVLVSPDATLAAAEDMMRANKIKTLLVSANGADLDGILDLYSI